MKHAAIEKILRRIAAGSVTRAEAALALDCSERQVNRLMRAHGVRRPVSEWRQVAEERRQATDERREALAQLALRVVNDGWTVERAAKAGDVSVRTMFRWLGKAKKTGKTSGK